MFSSMIEIFIMTDSLVIIIKVEHTQVAQFPTEEQFP
jgi:hypothetical protein